MDYDDDLTASSPDLQPLRHSEDSDPEEADIEEHIHPAHPAGFFFNRPGWPEPPADHRRDAWPSTEDRDAHDPELAESEAATLRRFLDMAGSFGVGRILPGMQTQNRETFTLDGGSVRRTTFTSGNGRHTTSVTITSGPIRLGPRRNGGGGGDDTAAFDQYIPAFDQYVKPPTRPTFFEQLSTFYDGILFANDSIRAFRTMLGGMVPRPPPPPPPGREGADGERATGGAGGADGAGSAGAGGEGNLRDPASELLISLQNLLGLLVDPANARHGDAVYTQEALDRIISNLMESNPQSNAAPPASEGALANLERKKMDSDMLAGVGGSVECTVCIDEIKIAEEVVYLPCKHWFHEACVVMWLREHNTCPICRSSIEPNNGSRSNNSANNNNDNSNTSNRNPTNPLGFGLGGGLPGLQQRQDSQSRAQDPRGRPAAFGWTAFLDPPSGRRSAVGTNLNLRDTLRRTTTGTSADRDQRWPNVGSRRSSMSPPNTADAGSRTRTRSPSTNSRRSAPSDQDNQRESGSRFSWFRDHFGRR